MALPKNLRLKGHRTFDYIYKNSKRYFGKFMDLRIAKPNEKIHNSHKLSTSPYQFKMAVIISKKVSKSSVTRNKIRRLLHQYFIDNLHNINNHIPYWLIVNLKPGDSHGYEKAIVEEFQLLISKAVLFKWFQ